MVMVDYCRFPPGFRRSMATKAGNPPGQKTYHAALAESRPPSGIRSFDRYEVTRSTTDHLPA